MTGAVLDPQQTFDLMSYCYPRWLTPFDYDKVISTLKGGTAPGPFLREPHGTDASAGGQLQAADTGSSCRCLLEVAGTIHAAGVVFEPVFQDTFAGTSAAGAGTYSIEEQNAQGLALYTRFFTPVTAQSDVATGPDVVTPQPSMSLFRSRRVSLPWL